MLVGHMLRNRCFSRVRISRFTFYINLWSIYWLSLVLPRSRRPGPLVCLLHQSLLSMDSPQDGLQFFRCNCARAVKSAKNGFLSRPLQILLFFSALFTIEVHLELPPFPLLPVCIQQSSQSQSHIATDGRSVSQSVRLSVYLGVEPHR
jgi:hypothetical protein